MKILLLINDLIYNEARIQLVWLSKLDLIKVLEACTPETKSTIEFCLVVSNLLALNDEDNQAVRMDYGIQICESNITQTVMENFLISEH